MKPVSKHLITATFFKLSCSPSSISDEDLDTVSNFAKSVYFSNENSKDSLASLRLKYISHGATNDIREVGPCYPAMVTHIKRACYQSGYLWASC